jgi:hypothetical protein
MFDRKLAAYSIGCLTTASKFASAFFFSLLSGRRPSPRTLDAREFFLQLRR